MCKAIDEIFADRTEAANKRAEMGENGRRYVLENYRWYGIVEKLRSVIEGNRQL